MSAEIFKVKADNVQSEFDVGDSVAFVTIFVGLIVTLLLVVGVLIVGMPFLAMLVFVLGVAMTVALYFCAEKQGRVLWPRVLLNEAAVYFAGGQQCRDFVHVPWRRIRGVRADNVGLNVRGLSVMVDVGELSAQELALFNELAYADVMDSGFMRVGVVTGVKKRDRIVAKFKEIGGVV